MHFGGSEAEVATFSAGADVAGAGASVFWQPVKNIDAGIINKMQEIAFVALFETNFHAVFFIAYSSRCERSRRASARTIQANTVECLSDAWALTTNRARIIAPHKRHFRLTLSHRRWRLISAVQQFHWLTGLGTLVPELLARRGRCIVSTPDVTYVCLHANHLAVWMLLVHSLAPFEWYRPSSELQAFQ